MRIPAVVGAVALAFVSLVAFYLSDFDLMESATRTPGSDQLAGFAGAAMAGAAVLLLYAATGYSARPLLIVWVALSAVFIPAALRLSFGTVLPDAYDLTVRCEELYELDETLERVAEDEGLDAVWVVGDICTYAAEHDELRYSGAFKDDVDTMVTRFAGTEHTRRSDD